MNPLRHCVEIAGPSANVISAVLLRMSIIVILLRACVNEAYMELTSEFNLEFMGTPWGRKLFFLNMY